jgi:hypothetical protein
VVWIVVVAFQTWRDIPQDDWVSVSEPTASQLTDAEVVLKPIVGIFDNPVARVVILDGIKLAFIPPILALACGSAYVWAFRKFPRKKRK